MVKTWKVFDAGHYINGELKETIHRPYDSGMQPLMVEMEEYYRLVRALSEIERFGHNEGHGCGYSCADIAQKALREDNSGGT